MASSRQLLSSLVPPPISKPYRSSGLAVKRAIRCSSHQVAPSLQPQEKVAVVARRSIIAALSVALDLASGVESAFADNFLDKYIKRKKLDPLESYIPAVLLSQAQFKDLVKSFDTGEPDYESSRFLLRSGPAASLRVNIRAVEQYAADDGKGEAASDAVDRCLRALEDLDSLLLHASRRDSSATVETMRSKIDIAISSLDSLLQTVPATILDQGKAVADAYLMPSEVNEENGSKADIDLKGLEEIL